MQPIISVRNARVSAATREHIEKACAKLRHFYERIVECEVVIEKRKRLGTAVEFIVKVPHQTLVASSYTEDENLFKTVDEAYERVEIQLKRYHDKQVAHR